MDSDQKSLQVELIAPLIVYRRAILIAVGAVMLLVLLFKLISPPSYVAAAVVSPTPRNGSTTDAMSRFSGLAGMAGVSLNSDQSSQNFDRFMYLLSSPELADWMIKNTRALELLYPGWDSKKHDWRAPNSVFRRIKWSILGRPSAPTPYDLALTLDEHTGFKKIPSPDTTRVISNIYLVTYTDIDQARAATFIRYIVDGSNEILRSQAQTRASRQAIYLQSKLSTTPTQEYRDTLLKLFSEQEQTLMLTDSHLPYAAEPLGDGYMVPRRVSKRTAMMTVVGGIIAFSIAYFAAIVVFNIKHRVS